MANELVYKYVGFIYQLKIKPLIMQIARILQAVILMMIVALAASCAASKEYSGKLFAPRTPVVKDSQAIALRFLELDNLETNKDNLVSTDIIMRRDTTMNTVALDNFAKTFPLVADTVAKSDKTKTTPVVVENKTMVADSSVVAKSSKPGEVRNKRTRE